MTSFNIYEAYAAVYNEDLREEILTVEEDFSFIDDLSDNELVQVMEEILSEREVTLDECFDAFDADLLSEETEMQRMNRLQNKATREKKGAAATAGRMKSAERERVGRKHAIKRLQVATSRAADNLKSNVKSKSEKAKTLAGGVASAVAGGAAEAGRKAKSGVEKVKGKLASAKEKIKGFIKSGRKAVAGGLRGLASKVEPKEATGKEVKSAAKETVSRRAAAASKASRAAEGTRGTSVVQGQPSGTFASKKSRVQAQKREARLTASENYEILADTILEDLISEGYAETFEEAFEVLESFSDYEVGELAENYLVEETVDLYDVVLEHLLDEGFADTKEAATVIMANMSEEWREEILEVKLDPRGRPASGPMNVYANPKGKPDQAHLDAVKAYDEKQKKKTPEQRKAELDAYIERQMNNK